MTSPELQTDTENAADDAGNVEADGQGDDGPAAQLSMAASVVLSALPRNTHQALQEAGQSTGKGRRQATKLYFSGRVMSYGRYITVRALDSDGAVPPSRLSAASEPGGLQGGSGAAFRECDPLSAAQAGRQGQRQRLLLCQQRLRPRPGRGGRQPVDGESNGGGGGGAPRRARCAWLTALLLRLYVY